tara:strand:- start:8214 stop:9005 length:792 start_codon:yes stop_codon:yes gene_type:complete
MNIAIFCNGLRGLKIANFLKKTYNIKLIFLSKKYLKKNIPKIFKNNKLKYQIISNINSKKICNHIKKQEIDINLIAGFPFIFKNELINSAILGTINLHAGRLPQYRGGSPLNWQIINNEKKVGVSIIKVNEKIDTGELLAQSNFRISSKDNIADVTRRAENEFLKIVKKGIKNLIIKNYLKKKGKDCFYRQRKPSDSEINLKRMTALEIKNLIRSCQKPYKAFYKKNKKKIYVNEVILLKRKDIKLINKNNIFYCRKGQIAFK